MAFWGTKAAISLKRVLKRWRKIDYGGPIGTHQRSFERYHSRLPMASLSRDWGLQLSYPLLSQEQVKLRTSNFVATFIGSIGTKAHEKCWE